MKKLLVLAAALCFGTLAMAHDTGRVLSATPVMERVAVPRQVCTMEPVPVERGRFDTRYRSGHRAPAQVEEVQHCTTQTFIEYRPVAYQTWQPPQAPGWYGQRRQATVRHVSTERRGNTWEDDFLDRQMR